MSQRPNLRPAARPSPLAIPRTDADALAAAYHRAQDASVVATPTGESMQLAPLVRPGDGRVQWLLYVRCPRPSCHGIAAAVEGFDRTARGEGWLFAVHLQRRGAQPGCTDDVPVLLNPPASHAGTPDHRPPATLTAQCSVPGHDVTLGAAELRSRANKAARRYQRGVSTFRVAEWRPTANVTERGPCDEPTD